MEIVHECCAGIDVHKKSVTVCLIKEGRKGEKKREIRTYSTFTGELLKMRDWLVNANCRHVAMESTGVYWKPVFNIIEGDMNLMLVNAHHFRAVPGRKTDVKDSEWLAELLQHGLLKGSFIPPKPIRELRDLTRLRSRLIEDRTGISNRILKVLEDANIKLSSVASDTFGASGMEMLESIIEGVDDPDVLAEMAKKRLREKIPQLRLALEGRVTEHHRFLLKTLLSHWHSLNGTISSLNRRIEEKMPPFEEEAQRICGHPGVDRCAAQNIIGEIGVDMNVFPKAKNLASWSGICPGNNESGGKRRKEKTRKGSKCLRKTLVQCARSAGRTKTYLGAQYSRIASRRGGKRAAVSVAHSILVDIYHILKEGVEYNELGSDYFDKLNQESLTRYHVKRLKDLGHIVTLERIPVAA